jgi:hypothetical protein
MLVRLWFTAALVAGLACAQGRGIGDMGGEGTGGAGGSGGAGGLAGEGMGSGGMPRGAQRQTRAELLAEKLKLNKDQKDEAFKILSDEAQNSRTTANKILNGRQQIATFILQKKTGEEMKPLMDAYTAVCAEMTASEAKAFGRIYALLKPNQQKNAASAFDLLDGMFMPAAAAGGGRGRGTGRGGKN